MPNKQSQPELVIKSRGNLLISINPETRSLILSPQLLDTFPQASFQKLMTEYQDQDQVIEVHHTLRIYEISWDTNVVVAVLEDLLELGFELCHHNNPNVLTIFANYNIKLKSKIGRPKKYDDPKDRHKVHYYKKKREQEEQAAENLRLKEELQHFKLENRTNFKQK